MWRFAAIGFAGVAGDFDKVLGVLRLVEIDPNPLPEICRGKQVGGLALHGRRQSSLIGGELNPRRKGTGLLRALRN
jgi:hypothetical protein